MSIPTYEEVMLPLLELIYDEEIYTNKVCEQKLSKIFKLTDEELNERLSSGKKTFYNRVHWAKTYLKNAELIESIEKGTFKITKKGKELVDSKPNLVDSRYLKNNYSKFSEYLKQSSKKKESDDSIVENIEDINDDILTNNTPLEEIEQSYATIQSYLKDELLEKLKKVDWYKFENIVVDLIIKMGYGGSKVETEGSLTKRSGDEGIDGIINEDRLGLDRIYLQAKRWKDTVSRPEIQKFAGALDGQAASKGIFITTSNFSNGALEYVKKLPNKKIILIDGYRLASLMIEFNVGVSVEVTYDVKRIDTDYFLDE